MLTEHKEAVHDGVKRYMCDKCGKGFPRRQKFDDHVTKCDRTKVTKSDEIIQCSACELTFTATCNYIQHYKYIHGSAPPTIGKY